MAEEKKNTVLVAMSGGVDSSVAAALLHEAGHEVIGVAMHLTSCHRSTTKSCCSAEDRLDAQQVCQTLGIPFHTLDYREQFRRDVIMPFIAEYARGRTPIPCSNCNSQLKFSAFFEDMQRMGADRVATGHYARREATPDGSFKLLRGVDRRKDQSYYLFRLGQRELARVDFPVGGLTKTQVRSVAKRRGLVTMDKPESQEICFVTNNDYVSFVETHGADQLKSGGNFVDAAGNVLGRHDGIHAYTVGQRRGLGVGFGKRMYVLEIRSEANEVVLGSDDDLFKHDMCVAETSWVHHAPSPDSPMEVQIRALHRSARATWTALAGDQVRIHFDEPQRAIAPGQSAVFYSGDEVLGGGIIQG